MADTAPGNEAEISPLNPEWEKARKALETIQTEKQQKKKEHDKFTIGNQGIQGWNGMPPFNSYQQNQQWPPFYPGAGGGYHQMGMNRMPGQMNNYNNYNGQMHNNNYNNYNQMHPDRIGQYGSYPHSYANALSNQKPQISVGLPRSNKPIRGRGGIRFNLGSRKPTSTASEPIMEEPKITTTMAKENSQPLVQQSPEVETISDEKKEPVNKPLNPMQGDGKWPPDLMDYIQRSFQACQNEQDKDKTEAYLKSLLNERMKNGSAFKVNWEVEPLPVELFNPKPGQMKQISRQDLSQKTSHDKRRVSR